MGSNLTKPSREGGVNKNCYEQLSSLPMLPFASPFQNNSNDRRPGAIIPLARREQWGGEFALISWKKIKMPRLEGGLQIRDLRIQNLEMGAKLL